MYIAIATMVVGVVLSNAAGRFGDAIADTYPIQIPKYDLYLDTVGYITKRLWFMPDLTLVLLGSTGLMACLFNYISIDYEQFIYELGLLYIIRAVACRLTVGYVSPRRVITRGLVSGGANCYYSDLVVSGHTMTACMMYYFMFDELRRDIRNTDNITVLSCVTMLWIVSVSSNLIVGDHYSSDVFLGLVLPYLLHY